MGVDLLTAAEALLATRPDLAAAVLAQVMEAAEAIADRDGWLAAAGLAVAAGGSSGDGRQAAATVLAGIDRWGPGALTEPSAHRLRVELALLAAGAGEPEMVRVLVGPVLGGQPDHRLHTAARIALARSAGDPVESAAALRAARERCPDDTDGRVLCAEIALVDASIARHEGSPRAAIEAAEEGLRLISESSVAAPDDLRMSLVAEVIAALLDAGDAREARARAAVGSELLARSQAPRRQRALLRLTVTSAYAGTRDMAVTVAELVAAAREAAESDAPDLEAICRAALGAIHEKAGRLDSALDEIRAGVDAQHRDRDRESRFVAAVDALLEQEAPASPQAPAAAEASPIAELEPASPGADDGMSWLAGSAWGRTHPRTDAATESGDRDGAARPGSADPDRPAPALGATVPVHSLRSTATPAAVRPPADVQPAAGPADPGPAPQDLRNESSAWSGGVWSNGSRRNGAARPDSDAAPGTGRGATDGGHHTNGSTAPRAARAGARHAKPEPADPDGTEVAAPAGGSGRRGAETAAEDSAVGSRVARPAPRAVEPPLEDTEISWPGLRWWAAGRSTVSPAAPGFGSSDDRAVVDRPGRRRAAEPTTGHDDDGGAIDRRAEADSAADRVGGRRRAVSGTDEWGAAATESGGAGGGRRRAVPDATEVGAAGAELGGSGEGTADGPRRGAAEPSAEAASGAGVASRRSRAASDMAAAVAAEAASVGAPETGRRRAVPDAVATGAAGAESGGPGRSGSGAAGGRPWAVSAAAEPGESDAGGSGRRRAVPDAVAARAAEADFGASAGGAANGRPRAESDAAGAARGGSGGSGDGATSGPERAEPDTVDGGAAGVGSGEGRASDPRPDVPGAAEADSGGSGGGAVGGRRRAVSDTAEASATAARTDDGPVRGRRPAGAADAGSGELQRVDGPGLKEATAGRVERDGGRSGGRRRAEDGPGGAGRRSGAAWIGSAAADRGLRAVGEGVGADDAHVVDGPGRSKGTVGRDVAGARATGRRRATAGPDDRASGDAGADGPRPRPVTTPEHGQGDAAPADDDPLAPGWSGLRERGPAEDEAVDSDDVQAWMSTALDELDRVWGPITRRGTATTPPSAPAPPAAATPAPAPGPTPVPAREPRLRAVPSTPEPAPSASAAGPGVFGIWAGGTLPTPAAPVSKDALADLARRLTVAPERVPVPSTDPGPDPDPGSADPGPDEPHEPADDRSLDDAEPDPGAVGCAVVVDLARDNRRFAGLRAATVIREVAELVAEHLPPGSRLRFDEPHVLALVLPGWAGPEATRWMYRTLPRLLAGFTASEDIPGVQLRATVHDVDGPVGAQLLHRVDAARAGAGGRHGAVPGRAGFQPPAQDPRPERRSRSAADSPAEPAARPAAEHRNGDAEHPAERPAAQPAEQPDEQPEKADPAPFTPADADGLGLADLLAGALAAYRSI